jgi:hypothetical protein
MRWTERGAHLLLQVRVNVLNNDLHKVFQRWYQDSVAPNRTRLRPKNPPTLGCSPSKR